MSADLKLVQLAPTLGQVAPLAPPSGGEFTVPQPTVAVPPPGAQPVAAAVPPPQAQVDSVPTPTQPATVAAPTVAALPPTGGGMLGAFSQTLQETGVPQTAAPLPAVQAPVPAAVMPQHSVTTTPNAAPAPVTVGVQPSQPSGAVDAAAISPLDDPSVSVLGRPMWQEKAAAFAPEPPELSVEMTITLRGPLSDVLAKLAKLQ